MPIRHFVPFALSALLAAAILTSDARAQQPATGPWGTAATQTYIDAARSRTLAACQDRGIELPADFLAWIDGDKILRS